MNTLKSTSNVLISAVLCLWLAACGGGGGSAGTVTGSTATKAPTLVVSLHAVSGESVNSISIGGAQTVRATVKDADSKPISGKLVTFSLQPTNLASLSPAAALTDENGVAKVGISVAATAQGAGQIEAQTSIGDVSVTGKFDFAVQPVSLSLGDLQVGSAALPSGGNTSISVNALIAGQPATGVPVNVVFAASCGRLNEEDAVKGITVPTDGNSSASVSYRAVAADGSLCQGRINISASTGGADTKASSLEVAPPQANAITFSSASPSQIFVAGSGAQEQSLVTFKVLAGSTPLSNVKVKFSILVNPGGVGLNATEQTSPIEVSTNSKGEATVSVFSGTIPGPVKVRAELASNSQIFSSSQNLTVASGPPSQRYMSLSVEKFNIEAWNRDGSVTQLTVRLADRQGNPVEDGTVVNFTAEGGQVGQSCATKVSDGVSLCSVNFVSQNPRPVGGRASVLAYVAGTKDYVDNNQNNKFDAGVDTLINQGDAYRDDNENGQWDNGEFIIPRGGNLNCAGAGAPFPAKSNTCDTSLSTTVRQQAVILFSSSQPDSIESNISTGGVVFNLGSLDNTLLPMPAGTTFSASTTDNTTGSELECSVKDVFGTPVPNVAPGIDPLGNLRTGHSISLKDCNVGDSVTITVRAPSGLSTSKTVTIPPSTTPPVIGDPDNIVAITPIPTQIFVAGNGLSEQATVAFQVRSGNTPLSNQKLVISIPNNIGGIEFNARGNKNPVTLTTDTIGQVALTVFSGTIPTPVKIRAHLEANLNVFTETQNLTIASGPPSQRYFSLSASKHSLDSGVDGDETTLTVYAADRQGNAVPDGTVINFTTEGGQVERSCSTTTSPNNRISSCSVRLVTTDPRPSNGRVSVLAYAEGTKDFLDTNGDNKFGGGDQLINLGNAYRDDDENFNYTSGEFEVTRGSPSAACPSAGAPTPSRSNTCDNLLQTTVRKQLNLLFSDSEAQFSILGADVIKLNGIKFKLSDKKGSPMPGGTSISAISRDSSCKTGDIFPNEVLDTKAGIDPNADLATEHFVSLTGCEAGTNDRDAIIFLTATSPISKILSTKEVTITVPKK